MIVFSVIVGLLMIAYISIGIYVFVLFLKLATRGIKALDIYNEKKKHVVGIEVQE